MAWEAEFVGYLDFPLVWSQSWPFHAQLTHSRILSHHQAGHGFHFQGTFWRERWNAFKAVARLVMLFFCLHKQIGSVRKVTILFFLQNSVDDNLCFSSFGAAKSWSEFIEFSDMCLYRQMMGEWWLAGWIPGCGLYFVRTKLAFDLPP